jgi:hypothetical protein
MDRPFRYSIPQVCKPLVLVRRQRLLGMPSNLVSPDLIAEHNSLQRAEVR